MKKMYSTFFLSLISITCLAQEKWELKKEENGIVVFARKLDNEKFKEIRVLCEFKGTAAHLIKVLQDIGKHKNWVYQTKVSNLISRKNRDTLLYYSETELPWPFNNRDAVVQLSFMQDTLTNLLKIKALSMPRLLPNKPNLVRIPYSLGLWNVLTLPNKHIKIDYTFSVDPGGALPAWLVNRTATIGPYNSFKKLKELIENNR